MRACSTPIDLASRLKWVSLLGLILAGTPAHAESPPAKRDKRTLAERFCEADDRNTCHPVIAFVEENDAFFAGQDRNYSQGFQLQYLTGGQRIVGLPALVSKALPFAGYLKGKEIRQGFGIAQEIYTPRDLEVANPIQGDRPYAAFLYFSGTAVATNPEKRLQDALQINLGVVGPPALGEQTQRNFHKLIGAVDPLGWDNQLRTEPAFEIIGQRLKAWRLVDLGPLESDVSIHGSAAAGSVRVYGALGGEVRLGLNLPSDFYSPRVRPAIGGPASFNPRGLAGGYLFFGIEGRGILRDLFLDGGTFRRNPIRLDKRPFVADYQAGFAMHLGRVQVSFTLVQRSESFIGQVQSDKFGAFALQVAL